MAKQRNSLLLLAGLTLLWPASAAAAGNQPQGISLTPFEQQLTIQPTDPAKTFDVILTNHTKSLQELDLTARDFGSLNDTGGILLEGSNDYSRKYGLASWLSLGTDTVVLQAGETRSLPVTVYNRSSLQPGGHYGAVVASVNSLNGQSGNRVIINQQLLSLILVDKVGGEHFDLKLAGISQNGNWLHLPNTVKLHFLNPGNVHVIPRGTVSLLSPSGSIIARGIINDDSSFVLPETYRDIFVTLTPVSRSFELPGPYHLAVNYRYDGINHYASRQFLVHYVDLKLYALIIVFVALGVWLYRRSKSKAKS